MMNDREKFGMQDKSEIMEQMKLYSIWEDSEPDV